MSACRRPVIHIAGRAAVIAAVALLAASCGDPAVNTGPLGNGGAKGGICIPIPQGQVESWGITDLENRGSSAAVAEKVSLVNPRHLRLVASYVVPITGHQDYGSWPGYPPAPQQHGVEWSQHTVAKGAHVAPMVGGRHANLVVVLKPTARVSKTRAIDVTYREGRTQYRMQTHYLLLILIGGLRACAGNWPQKYHVQV